MFYEQEDELEKFKLLLSSDNIKEVLGAFHKVLSQHTKEIAILTKRIQALLQNSHYGGINDNIQIFIETNNQRYESFSASLKSITEQVAHLEKSRGVEGGNTANKRLQDMSKTISILDTKITDLESELKEEKGKRLQLEEKIIDLMNSSSIDISPKLIKKGKKIVGRKTPLRNRPPSVQNTAPVQSPQSPPSPSQAENNESTSSLYNIQSNLNALKKTVQDMRIKENNDIAQMNIKINDIHTSFAKNTNEINEEFQTVHSRIDDCVSKADFVSFTQSLNENEQVSIKKLQTPRRSVHVTMINGDSLTRPSQRYTIHPSTNSRKVRTNYSTKDM